MPRCLCFIVTLSVELAPVGVGVTAEGLKLAVAPLGNPVTERLTDELYPLRAVSVTV